MNGKEKIRRALSNAGVPQPTVWKGPAIGADDNRLYWQYRAFGRSDVHVLWTTVNASLDLIQEWVAETDEFLADCRALEERQKEREQGGFYKE